MDQVLDVFDQHIKIQVANFLGGHLKRPRKEIVDMAFSTLFCCNKCSYTI